MIMRIHFTAKEISDSYEIVGDTIKDIRTENIKEMKIRGLDDQKNEMWSERIR